MIYLVSQIFIYLAIAIASGAIIGWLLAQLRNRTTLAGVVSQVNQLRREVERRDAALAAAQQQLAELSTRSPESKQSPALVEIADQLRQQCDVQAEQINIFQVELARVRQEQSATRAGEEASNHLITALHGEIARLRHELQQKGAENPKQTVALELANKELEGRLVRKLSEVDRLEQALAAEERRVHELERERELQNKSLHVLHQQLEMEREPPHRAAGRP